MRNYELNLLFEAAPEEAQLQSALGDIASLLQDAGALVLNQSLLGKRNLVSPVKKHTEAQLGTIKFALDPEKTEGVEKSLKANSNILRFILLSWTPKKAAPEPVMAKTQPAGAPVEAPAEPGEAKAELSDIDKKLEEIFNDENL